MRKFGWTVLVVLATTALGIALSGGSVFAAQVGPPP